MNIWSDVMSQYGVVLKLKTRKMIQTERSEQISSKWVQIWILKKKACLKGSWDIWLRLEMCFETQQTKSREGQVFTFVWTQAVRYEGESCILTQPC